MSRPGTTRKRRLAWHQRYCSKFQRDKQHMRVVLRLSNNGQQRMVRTETRWWSPCLDWKCLPHTECMGRGQSGTKFLANKALHSLTASWPAPRENKSRLGTVYRIFQSLHLKSS